MVGDVLQTCCAVNAGDPGVSEPAVPPAGGWPDMLWSSLPLQAKRQQRKLNFLITQTELYAHFMGGKHRAGADAATEEILEKLEDNSAHRQIDIGGGVIVNVSQEEYGGFSPLRSGRGRAVKVWSL